MTVPQLILNRLAESSNLALHEFNIFGSNQAAISARLRELARQGIVVGKVRKGTNYKEWSLVKYDGSQRLLAVGE